MVGILTQEKRRSNLKPINFGKRAWTSFGTTEFNERVLKMAERR